MNIHIHKSNINTTAICNIKGFPNVTSQQRKSNLHRFGKLAKKRGLFFFTTIGQLYVANIDGSNFTIDRPETGGWNQEEMEKIDRGKKKKRCDR